MGYVQRKVSVSQRRGQLGLKGKLFENNFYKAK
jgi:hypothetical protein